MNNDPYKALNVSRTATDDEIKRAYRKAALQCHPDKCKPEDKDSAEIQFSIISEAYEILKDPNLRQQYDAYGSSGIKAGRASAGGAGSRSSGPGYSPFGSSGFAFHDPRSLFEEVFGGRDPFGDAFFAQMHADPFSTRQQQQQQHHQFTHQPHRQHLRNSNMNQFNSPFGGHSMFSPFQGMGMMQDFGGGGGFSMSQGFGGGGGGGFSSFSSSSSTGGFGGGSGGNFVSQSSQTRIVNGERTTVTTTTDANGTRTETVVIGVDGREKKREVVENGRVVLSVGGGVSNGGMLEDDGLRGSRRSF
ncbi:DnaJ sub B member 1 [Chytriomyces hyalinus]|nr:DnaJ sub B member 1 [Chytriomyces hyalinus]